jgi:hypothetical protein
MALSSPQLDQKQEPFVSIRRLAVFASVSLVTLVALAGPAGATSIGSGSIGASGIVADDDYKWFYWAAPLLVLSALGIIGALSLGYYVRVIRPKYRGRKVS